MDDRNGGGQTVEAIDIRLEAQVLSVYFFLLATKAAKCITSHKAKVIDFAQLAED
jgi:hypothetical protein